MNLRFSNYCFLFSLHFTLSQVFWSWGWKCLKNPKISIERNLFKVRKIIALIIVLLIFLLAWQQRAQGFVFAFVVFHVSDGVGVNLLLWPILHSERSIIVIQEVCSSLLGWGHYKAPPCISSQEASISFNWIDKWKDEWDSTSPLHCWVVLSFCAQVCLFRFLALILRKQTEVFLHFCLLSCWVRSKSPCWRNLWYLCLRHVDVTLVVSYTFSNVNRTLLFS